MSPSGTMACSLPRVTDRPVSEADTSALFSAHVPFIAIEAELQVVAFSLQEGLDRSVTCLPQAQGTQNPNRRGIGNDCFCPYGIKRELVEAVREPGFSDSPPYTPSPTVRRTDQETKFSFSLTTTIEVDVSQEIVLIGRGRQSDQIGRRRFNLSDPEIAHGCRRSQRPSGMLTEPIVLGPYRQDVRIGTFQWAQRHHGVSHVPNVVLANSGLGSRPQANPLLGLLVLVGVVLMRVPALGFSHERLVPVR